MLSPKAGVTPGELKKAPVPPPPAGAVRWRGVPHGELVEEVLRQADRFGVPCRLRSAHLSRHGADLVACFDCGTPVTLAGVPYVPCLGVTASNRSETALRFYAGCRESEGGRCVVTKCVKDPSWKYREGLSVEKACRDGVVLWRFHSRMLRHWSEVLGRKRVQPDYALSLYARVANGRSRGFPWSRIGRADAAYRGADSHDGWTLLTLFGAVAAMNPPEDQLRQMWSMFKLLAPEESEAAG